MKATQHRVSLTSFPFAEVSLQDELMGRSSMKRHMRRLERRVLNAILRRDVHQDNDQAAIFALRPVTPRALAAVA